MMSVSGAMVSVSGHDMVRVRCISKCEWYMVNVRCMVEYEWYVGGVSA